MSKLNPGVSFVIIGILLSILVSAECIAAANDHMADPMTDIMPISWNDAYFKIINSPSESELEKGNVLFDMMAMENNTVAAQSVGLIDASPKECFKIVRNYNHYAEIMPYTAESKIVRSFTLGGENAGTEAVDFWTKVRVFGFETRYLLRVVHLSGSEGHSYQTYWTLVNNPATVSDCRDSNMRTCENDLDMNIGSHRFEQYQGNPNRTMHTYTLKVRGKRWAQCIGLRVGCGNSMRQVTEAIRRAVASGR